MGNTVSDMFYPDNPKRQRRCEELNNDLRFIKTQFDESHGRYKQWIGELSDILNRVLVKLGYDDIDQLNKDIQSKAGDEALKEWTKLQDALDTTDNVGGTIAGLSSLMALGGAAGAGVLVMLGVITVSTGGAALAVIGTVTAIIVLVSLLAGVIEGAIRRSKLRNAINDLFKKRRDARFHLEQMKAIEQYIVTFRNVLRSADAENKSFDEVMNVVSNMHFLLEPAKEEYDSVTYSVVDRKLLEEDKRRGSWRNEDPHIGTRSLALNVAEQDEKVARSVKVKLPPDVTGTDGKHHDLMAELHEEHSHTSAVVYLKQGDDYVHIVQRGSDLHTESTSKENAMFHIEFHERHLRPTTDTGEGVDWNLNDIEVPIAVRKFVGGAVSRMAHLSLHVAVN